MQDQPITIKREPLSEFRDNRLVVSPFEVVNINHVVYARWDVRCVSPLTRRYFTPIEEEDLKEAAAIMPALTIELIGEKEISFATIELMQQGAFLLGMQPRRLTFDKAIDVCASWMHPVELTWAAHWEKWEGFTFHCEDCGQRTALEERGTGYFMHFGLTLPEAPVTDEKRDQYFNDQYDIEKRELCPACYMKYQALNLVDIRYGNHSKPRSLGA